MTAMPGTSNGLKIDGSAVTQPISAAGLPLPTGAATAAGQPTVAGSGSTTSGQTGNLDMAAVTSSSPAYTNGQTNPLSLTTAGGLRIDGSAVTQPVSAASLPLPSGAATAANQTSWQGATGTAAPGNASYSGARAENAEPSPASNGNLTGLAVGLEGKLITLPFANKENMVRGTASQTGTSATTLIAAQGSGIKIYVTGVQCKNTGSATTIVTLNDNETTGSGTVLIVPTSGGDNEVYQNSACRRREYRAHLHAIGCVVDRLLQCSRIRGIVTVKRVLSFLSGLALGLIGPFGRMPAWAQLLTLGVGGVIGASILTPPALTPQLSAAFDSNIPNGVSNSGLKVNGGGAAGSMELPSTISNSWFETVEGTTDALFSGLAANWEGIFAPNLYLQPASGMVLFMPQISYDGTNWKWWNGIAGIYPASTPISMGANGAGYNSAIYAWTATGGGCAREPSGVWWPSSASTIAITDPGLNCNTAPVIAPASIPGVGATQALSTGATSCVANSPVSGEMTVTTSVAIAHGIAPGQTFPLSGFTGGGNTGYNATYTALAGTTGTTLIGETTTGGGTCPANSPDTSGGFALSGTGASIIIPAFSITAPYAASNGTGIIAKNNDHFCAVLGEYGADSPTPGVQFLHLVDQNGVAYPGAPSVPASLNQGAVSFNGYIIAGTQDTTGTFTASFGASGVPSTLMTVTGSVTGTALAVGQTITGPSVAPNTTIASLGTGSGGAGTYFLSTSNVMASSAGFTAHTYAPALTVTSMNSVSITGATWSSANNGTITFTAAANWVLPGTVFTVSGASPGSYNGTYIAGVGTNATGTTIAAVSWPVASLANPGSYVSGGSFVGTIEPGMYVPGVTGQQVISPYGTFGGSGTGGAGTYGLTVAAENSFNITASISGTTLNVTTSGAGSFEQLVPGQTFTTVGGVSSGTQIVAQTSGTGGTTGNYTVNNSQTVSSQTLTLSGNIWSAGTPGILYAANPFYYTITPSYTVAWLGQASIHTQAVQGDVTTGIGAKGLTLGTQDAGAWGGELANAGMHWGVFPQDSSGNPSTASLASLCQKTTDYQAFDAANSITADSLYRLNDPGEWGDSSYATITGYLSGASGTSGGAATLHVLSTVFGTLALPTGTATGFLAAPGLPPSPTPASVNPASIPLTTSAGSTYTVTFPAGVTSINLGSSGSPVQFSVGKWKPLAPLGTAFVNGYITSSGGSGACASNPCLNVTSIQTGANTLGATFTGTYNPALATNNLTVSGITGSLQAGMLITDGGVSLSAVQPLLLTTATCTATCTAYGGYYPSTIGPESMTATLSTVSPGQLIAGPGVNTPVQIVGYGAGTSLPAAGATYVLSNAANGAVGSSGSPVAFTLSSVTGGGAVAPGPALTVTEIGAGEMFAVTNYPSSSPTGSIRLKGTYSTASLGGTPSAIQAQLSLTAGGPAIAGFSWANLSSPSIGGGNWSGSIASVPPGLYWVSVRAANGAAYATMRNFVSVGMVVDTQGEGNPGAYFSAGTGGDNNTIITGIDSVMWASGFGSPNVYGPFLGPFGAANKFRLAFSREIPANRLTQQASGLPLAEGPTNFDQAFWNGAGVGVGQIDVVYPGIGSVVALLGNQPQSQTIGIGNGSNATFCSLAIYCSVSAAGIGSSGSGPLAYNAAGLTGATITGYVTTAAGVSTLHVSTLAAGALEPGLVLSGAGVAGSPNSDRMHGELCLFVRGRPRHDLDAQHQPGDDRLVGKSGAVQRRAVRRGAVAQFLRPGSWLSDGPERGLRQPGRQVRLLLAQRQRNGRLHQLVDLLLHRAERAVLGRGDRKLIHQLRHRRLRHRVLIAAGVGRDHPGVMDQHRLPQRDHRQ